MMWSRWCRTVFLWMSFVSIARGDVWFAVENFVREVTVPRGSISPTHVAIQVLIIDPDHKPSSDRNHGKVDRVVAMMVGFDVSKDIQCGINGTPLCFNVSMSSNETTDISLRAPVSKDDVIQDTVVSLEPVLRYREVAYVLEGGSTVETRNFTDDEIMLRNIAVTLRDDRRLCVGFTRSNTVYFNESGTARLFVMNFDAPLRLREPLNMSIIVRHSDDKSYVSRTTANIAFPEHNISAPILIIDQELDYSQHYEATIVLETPNNNVQLDPSTVQITYSPDVKLVKLIQDMKKQEEDSMQSVQEKLQSVQEELQMLESVVNKSTIAASIRAETKPDSTTTTEKPATTIAPQTTETTEFNLTAETTEFNQTATTDSAITKKEQMTPTPSTLTKPKSTGSTGTTGAVDKSNLSTTEEDVEGAEDTDSNDTFMWWILAGFVVLMVITVSGYLLYNHRAKVMVYVGSVWKGNSDKLPTTGQPNRRRNKYTPLPTSIHDTLTHED